MGRRGNAPSNVLPFHTAHWHAREQAKKRLKQLFDEMDAIEAWLEPVEACDTRPASSASGGQRGRQKRATAFRLCE